MDTADIIRQQIDEMDRHKWIESEKVGYDLGEAALFDWVDTHAVQFVESTRLKINKPRSMRLAR